MRPIAAFVFWDLFGMKFCVLKEMRRNIYDVNTIYGAGSSLQIIPHKSIIQPLWAFFKQVQKLLLKLGFL